MGSSATRHIRRARTRSAPDAGSVAPPGRRANIRSRNRRRPDLSAFTRRLCTSSRSRMGAAGESVGRPSFSTSASRCGRVFLTPRRCPGEPSAAGAHPRSQAGSKRNRKGVIARRSSRRSLFLSFPCLIWQNGGPQLPVRRLDRPSPCPFSSNRSRLDRLLLPPGSPCVMVATRPAR